MTRPETTLTKAFAAGADARAAGFSLVDNPYPINSSLHEEWHAGWEAIFDLDEEDDPLSSRMREQDDAVAAG